MIVHGSINYTPSGRKRKSVKRVKKITAFAPTGRRPTTSYADIRMAEAEKYKSVSVTAGRGDCSRTEPQKYTGTLVKGIGTMHKSNAIPIIDEEQMKDIARMRR